MLSVVVIATIFNGTYSALYALLDILNLSLILTTYNYEKKIEKKLSNLPESTQLSSSKVSIRTKAHALLYALNALCISEKLE